MSRGTADRHSDIDLAVVAADDAEVAAVAATCTEITLHVLPVFHHFEQRFGTFERRGFLLESFLEVDVGIARPGEVEAGIEQPPFDASAKLDFICHDVIHAAVALKRGRPWRALWYVERLRNRALELAAARDGLDSRHFADSDDLPAGTLAGAEQALARAPVEMEIWPALGAATHALLAEGRRTHPELVDKL